MSKSLALKEHAEEAAIHRCDLNTLYSVIAILEGGTISSKRHSEVNRIIKICKEGSRRSLAAYDRHLSAISEGREP